MTQLDVLAELTQRGVRRLTHFTAARNLPHILAAGQIISTAQMLRAGAVFQHTDPKRLDGHPEYVCANIEYPNTFYFRTAVGRPNASNYPDWAVLLIRPDAAAIDGTLFCPLNAAAAGGAYLRPGRAGIAAMYASTTPGQYSRSQRHWPASPTDVQAEVLIPGAVPMSAVDAIVVPDADAASREVARLEQIGVEAAGVRWFVSPRLFDASSVRRAVRESEDIPIIGPWEPTPACEDGPS